MADTAAPRLSGWRHRLIDNLRLIYPAEGLIVVLLHLLMVVAAGVVSAGNIVVCRSRGRADHRCRGGADRLAPGESGGAGSGGAPDGVLAGTVRCRRAYRGGVAGPGRHRAGAISATGPPLRGLVAQYRRRRPPRRSPPVYRADGPDGVVGRLHVSLDALPARLGDGVGSLARRGHSDRSRLSHHHGRDSTRTLSRYRRDAGRGAFRLPTTTGTGATAGCRRRRSSARASSALDSTSFSSSRSWAGSCRSMSAATSSRPRGRPSIVQSIRRPGSWNHGLAI